MSPWIQTTIWMTQQIVMTQPIGIKGKADNFRHPDSQTPANVQAWYSRLELTDPGGTGLGTCELKLLEGRTFSQCGPPFIRDAGAVKVEGDQIL